MRASNNNLRDTLLHQPTDNPKISLPIEGFHGEYVRTRRNVGFSDTKLVEGVHESGKSSKV